jgi:hypothetical protein
VGRSKKNLNPKPKQVDLLENLSTTELAASVLWGAFFYFGIFDINTKTNVPSQASGQAGAVRPSDWLKVKLGSLVGESQVCPSSEASLTCALGLFQHRLGLFVVSLVGLFC